MPFTSQKQKKKPPPRPPPPDFSKYKSKSTLNLNHQSNNVNLIEWSPPSSPKQDRPRHFGGSVSSSFSSSTSSIASSKKSFEFDLPLSNNLWPVTTQTPLVFESNRSNATFQSYISPINTKAGNSSNNTINVPSLFGPTIIRPKTKLSSTFENSLCSTSNSPPMPNIPPPSPPKELTDIETPYGIALFNYPSDHPGDLPLQTGDVVVLLRRVNNDWLYGRVIDREGIFPEKYIDIQVPLKGEENIVTVLYDFTAEMPGDLSLKCGQKIKVTKKVSDEWLYGECDGQTGQFPANFVNFVPKSL